ncbi:hypothetical protein SKAU_G00010030 [Synaphobranchus kaupii]|uniref:Uncharacterized protein n=1 Tax=Synaphobranchus kaupii TaxID=118154 RepID=A0A9Q1G9T6_SYNKA|nr:hypothetical protein SKAU_G00010030 [Synaphobranchus kaupii]
MTEVQEEGLGAETRRNPCGMQIGGPHGRAVIRGASYLANAGLRRNLLLAFRLFLQMPSRGTPVPDCEREGAKFTT